MNKALYAACGAAALTLVCAAARSAGPAAAFELVSSAEANKWNAHDAHDPDAVSGRRDMRAPGSAPDCHDAKPKESADSPLIKILAPSVGKPLTPPLDINVQFVPASGAAIRPETFRVCYVGFITVDITKRITAHVDVSAQGLQVSGAQLPSGHHHLVMLIADNHGNAGRSEAQIDIQ